MKYNSFKSFLENEQKKDYYKEILEKVEEDEKKHIIYPKYEDRLNAYNLTELSNIKVVILGQDPYINENEAMGLAFSIREGAKIPPSLKNIFKEIENSTNCDKKTSGDLTYLCEQGVFLLNTVLTVRKGESNSHKNFGYNSLIINTIKMLDELDRPVVFMLWGNNAKQFSKYISNENHLILTAYHPSPLAGGKFLGCNHFNIANDFLEKNNIEKIKW